MARLDKLPEPLRSHVAGLECPTFETNPWVKGPPLQARRLALVSTAGIHRRDDRPFEFMSGEYRIIPGDATTNDLVMSHISANFDRTGFQQDCNVVFPLDRLREMTKTSLVGSVADFHYSFMGAADPREMEAAAAEPGRAKPTSGALADWFLKENVAARVLRAVKEACRRATDPMLKMTGERLRECPRITVAISGDRDAPQGRSMLRPSQEAKKQSATLVFGQSLIIPTGYL